MRAGLIAVALLLAGLGIWLAAPALGGAAIAPGVVKVDMNRKTVQHQEGGIVGEILVRDGQRVKAGEALIVLKDVRVDAGNELVQTQLDAEWAKVARQRAEQAWAPAVTFPPDLVARRKDPRIEELLQRESSLFRARRGAYERQVALIRTQITETRTEVQSREQQLESDATAIRLQREELAANEALLAQG